MQQISLSLTFLLLGFFSFAQITGPEQPASGPGGAEYVHDSIWHYTSGLEKEGFNLFAPMKPTPDTAPVVIFVHGYAAYNPAIYGGWIAHLVKRGSVVIFPNYQRHLFNSPNKFTQFAAQGIKDAIAHAEDNLSTKLNLTELAIAGHSFGGTISANLMTTATEHGLPQPKVALICQPGYGPFKGSRIKDFSLTPEDLMVTIVSGADDKVVADRFALEIFNSIPQKTGVQKNYLQHRSDKHGKPPIHAQHIEPVSPYLPFDNGVRNFVATASLVDGKADAVDFFCYWKLLDAMIDCQFRNENCDIAFSDSDQVTFMGEWSDGKEVKRLVLVE